HVIENHAIPRPGRCPRKGSVGIIICPAGRIGIEAVGHPLVEILHIHHHAQANLLEVALARSTPRIFTSPRKDGKQNRGEDRYDSYNHQQLYQCKTSATPPKLRLWG